MLAQAVLKRGRNCKIFHLKSQIPGPPTPLCGILQMKIPQTIPLPWFLTYWRKRGVAQSLMLPLKATRSKPWHKRERWWQGPFSLWLLLIKEEECLISNRGCGRRLSCRTCPFLSLMDKMDWEPYNRSYLMWGKIGEDQGLAARNTGVSPSTAGLVDGNHIFGMVYDVEFVVQDVSFNIFSW